MKIAQINAQRAMAAAANLEILIKEFDIDILCVQEPYVYKNEVRGYSSYKYTVVQPGVDSPLVAAVVANENFEIFHLAQYDSPHVLCFQVVSDIEEIYLINVYCQFSLRLDTILMELDRIITELSTRRLLITVDSNAKSELWYAEETDERGRIMQDFLAEHGLYVLNEVNNLPTFETINGQSNIDLTIINGSLIGCCTGWMVSPECTTSDHNLIVFDIVARAETHRKFIKHDCFNIKKANWISFNELIMSEFTDEVASKLYNKNPEEAVEMFSDILGKICRRSIPEKKRCNKAIPWWNEVLAKMRIELNRARKSLSRIKRLKLIDQMEHAKMRYKNIRNGYVAEIRKSKQESWQDFVTTEANKDVWSLPYKIVRDKIRKNEIITALTLEDGTSTVSSEDTIKALLNKCVPKNDKAIEVEMHKEILTKIKKYKNYNMENEITIDEINISIKRLKNGTAPGIDKFTTEIIKQVWIIKPQIIYSVLNNCFKNKVFLKLWKISKLKIILKDKNKDKKLINSYRPISLISTMSKIYERIIVERLQESYRLQGLENSNQYGFRKGKSTEDAITHLLKAVKNTEKNTLQHFLLIYKVLLIICGGRPFFADWLSLIVVQLC